jgi:hypothetical protein
MMNTSNSDTTTLLPPPLSLTEDICESGVLSVYIILGILGIGIAVRVALYNATSSTTTTTATTDADAPPPPRPQTQRLTKNHHWLEQVLVTPFVPTSLETLVLYIYFVWFCFTVTMGITRYYEKRWGDDVIAQQGPFNVLTELVFGCRGLDPQVIPYQYQRPAGMTKKARFRPLGGLFSKFKQKKSSASASSLETLCDINPLECSEDIDFYFGHHLALGTLWLTFGALQIYMARSGWSVRVKYIHTPTYFPPQHRLLPWSLSDIHFHFWIFLCLHRSIFSTFLFCSSSLPQHDRKVRRKAHKLFGTFVALPIFFGHLGMACRIAWRNPVNQSTFISLQYFAMIAESFLLAMNGIWFAMEGNHHGMHIVRMFFTWIQSVVGSGSIRLTAWILWLIGKFFR